MLIYVNELLALNVHNINVTEIIWNIYSLMEWWKKYHILESDLVSRFITLYIKIIYYLGNEV